MRGCFLKVDFEYTKVLNKLHSNYPSAPDKVDIKVKIMSAYQLKIADDYNISIANVKKLVPNFFNKKVRASLQILATKKSTLCVMI